MNGRRSKVKSILEEGRVDLKIRQQKFKMKHQFSKRVPHDWEGPPSPHETGQQEGEAH